MANNRYRVRRKKNRAALMCILFGTITVLCYSVFDIALMPVLRTAAVNKAKIVAIYTINDAVGKVLREDGISYDKLMSVEKDSAGTVTAVSANTVEINMLKYDITSEVIKELNNIQGSELAIPFGTVLGGPLFTGRGPMINIRIQPIGSVNSNVVNDFTSAGINQTRQQIMLDIRADITLMIANYNVSTSVESNISVADIVIVGGVPGSYTYVGDTGDGSDRIFTYGKNTQTQSSSSKASAKSSSGKNVK